MALIKCTECGKEFNEGEYTACPECGNPVSAEKNNVKDSRKNEKISMVITTFYILSIIFIILAAIFFYKAYDVKNNYYSSEYSFSTTNAYVGGDAYNYIINGTYFTGYSVLGASGMICATLFFVPAMLLEFRDKKE